MIGVKIKLMFKGILMLVWLGLFDSKQKFMVNKIGEITTLVKRIIGEKMSASN